MDFKEVRKYYKGKRVFVTGHTGFKGSWLTLWLLDMGAKVCGYSLKPNTEPNHFNELGLKKDVVNHFADIRDFEKLRKAVKEFKPEIVFHLAAQPIVKKSYTDSRYTFDVNVMGLVNLLEVVKECSFIKSVVVITSDKCYRNNEWEKGYKETDTLGGIDPYSSSKACAELVSGSYFESFFKSRKGFSFATVRAGNVIGGGDWSEYRIIPDCVRAVTNGKKIVIRNPKSTRPWQNVLEPLSGYLLLCKEMGRNKELCGAWNFGPLKSGNVKVLEVVKMFIQNWKGSYEVKKDKSKHHEAGLLELDCTKAKKLLGWKSKLTVKEALEYTAGWYRRFYEREDVKALSLEMIKKYES